MWHDIIVFEVSGVVWDEGVLEYMQRDKGRGATVERVDDILLGRSRPTQSVSRNRFRASA